MIERAIKSGPLNLSWWPLQIYDSLLCSFNVDIRGGNQQLPW